jgi:D-sedoheptulose 7-phosphate isomerase
MAIADAFKRHSDIMQKTTEALMADIERGASILEKAVKNGNCLFVCGNGGSAADSQHFAAEFVCKYKNDRRPLPAIALTVNTSALTAIGNDYGFDHVFSRQIEALSKKGDVLVTITTSGASKNILSAIAKAKELGLTVIVLTGARGKTMKADLVLAVPSEETARIQEMHELIYHAWCEYVDSTV